MYIDHSLTVTSKPGIRQQVKTRVTVSVTSEIGQFVTKAADTGARKENLQRLLRCEVELQSLHRAEDTRKGVVSLLGPFVGPVSYEMLQSLRDADSVGLPFALLGILDVFVELFLVYSVELQSIGNDAFADHFVFIDQLLDIRQLLVVLDAFLQYLTEFSLAYLAGFCY
jgi:hypothetical protein